jgi:hypothetical protein
MMGNFKNLKSATAVMAVHIFKVRMRRRAQKQKNTSTWRD